MKKRILALLLAATMAFAMPLTAFADEESGTATQQTTTTYSITINNTVEGHIYEAYQIFAGDLSKDETTLSNVKWGTGVNAAGQTALGDAATKAASLKTIKDAEDFAKEVAIYLDTVAGTDDFKDKKYEITGLEAGYYLIKDKTGSLEGSSETYTDFILELVDDVDVTPKSKNIVPEKKVQDINDSTDTAYSELQDSADYDIGDLVPFTLTGTLPEDYDKYAKYYYEFRDTMEAGLTLITDKPNQIVVKVDDETIDISKYGFSSKEIVENEEKKTQFSIIFEDLKTSVPTANSKSKITVEFKAELNEDAVIGQKGNKNDFVIEYSNNPNGDGYGITKPDAVIVFTYKLDVKKVTQVNGKNEDLTGAGFALYKKYNNAPEGKNDADKLSNNETYKKQVKEFSAFEGFTDAEDYYFVSEIKSTEKTKITQFEFKGIDDGEYVLVETQTPDGYNSIVPQKFTVEAEHVTLVDVSDANRNGVLTSLNGKVTSGTITFTSSKEDGTISTDVLNNKGSLLPSTGGIGTTIFYVIGGILVIGAGVILFVRKRMSAED